MLVLVVTDHDDVVTKNRTLHLGRLFIILFVGIVGAGASTLALTFTFRFQFGIEFSLSLIVLLPVCFIFHRVQFYVRETLPFGSVAGIAVASIVNAPIIPIASVMILLRLH
jgi:hypothetical protein